MTLSELFKSIADAIRGKDGTTDTIPATDFPARIGAIETGIKLPQLTTPGGAADLRKNKQLIDQTGQIVNGGLEEVQQATPSISVSSAGLITASASQSGGIVTAGTQSATKQLSTQAGGTRTPGTSDTTIVHAGQYAIGDIVMKGDANLVSKNIKSGVSIFGVSGTAETRNTVSATVTNSRDVYCTILAYGLDGYEVELGAGESVTFNTEVYGGFLIFYSGDKSINPQKTNATYKTLLDGSEGRYWLIMPTGGNVTVTV